MIRTLSRINYKKKKHSCLVAILILIPCTKTGFQEPMKDPQIAADGFTYEAEAIEGWFASGHDTSPMTNLKLDHHELIPNHTLRHAIQGWLQQITQNRSWDKEIARTNLSSTNV